MEVREIKALLALMQDYELVELEIEDKKGKVRLVRAGLSPDGSANTSRPQAPSRQPPIKQAKAAASAKAAPAAAASTSAAPELGANQKLVESPMVGTFYRAASPEASPLVEEGDSVRKGQTLCIIEAMKMMNEIEAPAAGRVVKVLCENAQPVEYGQALMIIEIG